MDDFRIFFEYNSRVVQIPVNPESLKIEGEIDNEKINLFNDGEIVLIGNKNLKSIEIESFFPQDSVGSYVTTKGEFEGPQFYKDFFNGIVNDKKPCRLILNGTDVNMLVAIDSFDIEWQAGDPDVHFLIKLSEYRTFTIKTVNVELPRPIQPTRPASTAQSGSPVTVGCNVIVNGRLHRDSYGNGPGQTRTNYRGKINFIKNGRSHPYHVTQPDGGWLGWVVASAVTVV